MSVNQVDKQTGDTSRIAGGTLYADAPIGAILAFGGSSAPAGWLLCQGQAISRTTYAALFAVIGTAYGAGDGSTTFNLPDPREAALIGAGTNVLNAGSIAAHNAVNLGAFQDDQFQTHAHHVYINNDPNHPVLSNKNLKANGEDYWNVNPSGTYPIVASTEFEGNRAGTTTHGKQLGVNYIIKAQQVALPLDIEEAVDKKVSKFSGTSGGNTYVTVDQLAYDQTNKTLGLKVDGADTVIPFKKGYEWKFAGTATTSQTVTVTVDVDGPYLFIFKGIYDNTTNFYCICSSLDTTSAREILNSTNTAVVYAWGTGTISPSQTGFQKNGDTYIIGNPYVTGDIYYMAIPLSDVI